MLYIQYSIHLSFNDTQLLQILHTLRLSLLALNLYPCPLPALITLYLQSQVWQVLLQDHAHCLTSVYIMSYQESVTIPPAPAALLNALCSLQGNTLL